MCVSLNVNGYTYESYIPEFMVMKENQMKFKERKKGIQVKEEKVI